MLNEDDLLSRDECLKYHRNGAFNCIWCMSTHKMLTWSLSKKNIEIS